MTPNNHPTDAVLTDYASGALSCAFAAVTAAHLERCAHCRAKVAALESAGLALIETLPAADLPAGLLDSTLAALDDAVDPAPAISAPTRDRIPFGREVWLAPGMSIRKARLGHGEDLLYLLRLPAGIRTLPHGHQGAEFTTVLSGAYMDRGEEFAAGDFCEMDPDVDHQPQVTGEGECICLIASEKPMRMASGLGRFVQTFIGV